MIQITCEEMRVVCIKNGWFTEGTNTQYEKLFYAIQNDFTLEEIIAIIWTCSEKTYREIKAYMEERYGDAVPLTCDICTDRGYCPEYIPGSACVNDRGAAGGDNDAADPE